SAGPRFPSSIRRSTLLTRSAAVRSLKCPPMHESKLRTHRTESLPRLKPRGCPHFEFGAPHLISSFQLCARSVTRSFFGMPSHRMPREELRSASSRGQTVRAITFPNKERYMRGKTVLSVAIVMALLAPAGADDKKKD